jgi:hypothetical protein
MRHNKTKKNDSRKRKRDDAARINATRASVAKEMAEPRMARSARIAERNLDPRTVREEPSTTLTGTVPKIISSRRRDQPGRAELSLSKRTAGIGIFAFRMR